MGQGNVLTKSYFNQSFSLMGLDIETQANNAGIAIGGTITTGAGGLWLETAGVGSSITLGGNIIDTVQLKLLTSGTGSNINLPASLQGGIVTLSAAHGTVEALHDVNIQSSAIITLTANTTIYGDLTLQSGVGTDITLDTTNNAYTIAANDINITGNNIKIQNASTLLLARGSAQTVFDDDINTPAPTITAGTYTAVTGNAGTVSIDGDLQSIGTVRAMGAGPNIYINYTHSDLDLSNVTLIATGAAGAAGNITLTNNSNGNDGTLDAQAGTNSGIISILTDNGHTITGTAVSVNADSVNINATGAVSLNGNFHTTPINAAVSSGALTLTDQTSALNIGTLQGTGAITLTSGSITQYTGGSGVITAGLLTLNSTNDIGSLAHSLLTSVGSLSVNSTTGGAYIAQTGALSLTTSSVADLLKVTGTDNIDVNGLIHSANRIVLNANGNLIVNGLTHNGQLLADGVEGTPGNETIVLTAGGQHFSGRWVCDQLRGCSCSRW